MPAGRALAQARVLGAQLIGPGRDGVQCRVRLGGEQAVNLGLGLRGQPGFGDPRHQAVALCAPGQGIGGNKGEGQREGGGRDQGRHFHPRHSSGLAARGLAGIWPAAALVSLG
ncbi:hypothetical protein D3C71_1401970 [compost metagenome]